MPTRALLDTRSFLWFVSGDPRLSTPAREFIEASEHTILLSIASVWEIAIKQSVGKLSLAHPFGELIPDFLKRERIDLLSIQISHLTVLTDLPFHRRDPFDRLIIAQAITEDLPIMGVDEAFEPVLCPAALVAARPLPPNKSLQARQGWSPI